jgi:hypothetical protein
MNYNRETDQRKFGLSASIGLTQQGKTESPTPKQ